MSRHYSFSIRDGMFVDTVGTIFYVKNKLIHRENGPAVEYIDGDKFWYIEDYLHRLDGPAIEFSNGYKEWYVNGQYLTEHEFSRQIKQGII